MSTLSQFAQGGKIKSIQRGLTTLNNSTSSSSVIINSVDTSKSILYHLGTSTASTGGDYNRTVYLTLTNSTTITVAGATNAGIFGDSVTVSWQLVEYY